MTPIIPVVEAVMRRRILVNFRIRPEVVAPLLPPPFQPKLVAGWAMGGICLIRLEEMRPTWLPRACRVSSENAAHRIAVTWTENGRKREGVFIPRRDTNSVLNRVAGGRLFPSVPHSAKFVCAQEGNRFQVALRSQDGETRVNVVARKTDQWPAGSVFNSLASASEFFRSGACGWSPAKSGGLEGVELQTDTWKMHALVVERAESSFFDDLRRFPRGSIEFDSALLMEGIPHRWHALGEFGKSPQGRADHYRRTLPFFEMP
jgi:hypothetical protein